MDRLPLARYSFNSTTPIRVYYLTSRAVRQVLEPVAPIEFKKSFYVSLGNFLVDVVHLDMIL